MTTGENVGAAVDSAIQQEQQNSADAIAQAQASADAAQREAKRIADAAIATELGAQIAAQRQEMQTWQTATEQRLAAQAETTQRLEAQSVETTGLLGSIRALLTPTQPQPDTQKPLSPDTAPTDANSVKTEPKEPPKVAAEQHPEPPRKRRHFL
jgi:hypothetical protein